MPGSTGHVIQVTGAVVEVQVVGGEDPADLSALRVVLEGTHDEVPEQAFYMEGQN